jgi:5-methylcytosine-specific restriction endonuclease McrA
LRREVRDRAAERCEYCLMPERLSFHTHPVDHIIAQKHGGQAESENLALACIACNQAKGSDIASIDPAGNALVPLFNPRREIWSEHFELRDAFIVPRSAVGRATARLLQFNAPERVEERELQLQAGELKV